MRLAFDASFPAGFRPDRNVTIVRTHTLYVHKFMTVGELFHHRKIFLAIKNEETKVLSVKEQQAAVLHNSRDNYTELEFNNESGRINRAVL